MKRRGKTKVFVEVSTVTCSLLVVMEEEGEVTGGRTECRVPTALSETAGECPSPCTQLGEVP